MARGRSDAVRELAVIGEDEQTFAGIIESADGEHAFLHATQQVHDGLASFWIGDRGDAFARLVERDVDMGARGFEQCAVHFDVVGFEIRFGAELGDNFAVHHHAALKNHVFGLATAGYAGLG